MKILIRLLINAAALWAAVQLVPGVSYTGDGRLLLVVALIFGVLNTCLKPLLIILTLPFLLITLGFFTFVLNAFLLWMTSELSARDGSGISRRGLLGRVPRRAGRQRREHSAIDVRVAVRHSPC